MFTLIQTPDEIVKDALLKFSKGYTNVYDEPQSFHDVIRYDDEKETIVCLRITEMRYGLEEKEYYYSVDIIVTDNEDVDEIATYDTNSKSEKELIDVIKRICKADWTKEYK